MGFFLCFKLIGPMGFLLCQISNDGGESIIYWREVYYEDYLNTGTKGEKSLPYNARSKSYKTLNMMCDYLKSEGFKQVESSSCIVLLVNLELRRFCMYPKAVNMASKNKGVWSDLYFLKTAYFPWKKENGNKISWNDVSLYLRILLTQYIFRWKEHWQWRLKYKKRQSKFKKSHNSKTEVNE